MEMTKKQEKKLFEMFKNTVNNLAFIVLKNEPSLSEKIIRKSSDDVAKMLGEYCTFIQSLEKVTDRDVHNADLILTEHVLNISKYVDSFSPCPNQMIKITSTCAKFLVKTNMKAMKWSKKNQG